MADKISTITHSEICAVAAGKLGNGFTAEKMDEATKAYATSMIDLMTEKAPNSSKETLTVQTPFVAYKVKYEDECTIKNPDGTTTKCSGIRKVVPAAPNALLRSLNAENLNRLGDNLKKVGVLAGKIAKAVSSAKAAA